MAVDGQLGIGWHQHQIGAGLQGQHGRFPGPVLAGNRLHHQGIGHHQACKAQLLPQQAMEHGPERVAGRGDRGPAG
jgi:hypothetical protein